ncbi:MAG: mannose-6-phosphate isomerase, class I [Spirochaetales bacterium]|nr:mannose-6-phosphate isomerase, class I [Spirochaetales bacterium]
MKSKYFFKLDNIVQNYAWGSKSSFTTLLGINNPENKPMAELWMGAHPKAPSMTDEGPLGELIGRDPETFLGSIAANRFEGKLPFLFKVLAAGAPLSIQAHPSKAQAEEGYGLENTLKVPFDAFNRNYKDDNHKPEILCALTPFTAMWGFRSRDEIAAHFKAFGGLSEAEELIEHFSKSDDREALKGFLEGLMSMERGGQKRLIETCLKNCDGGTGDTDDTGYFSALVSKWIKKFAELYPGDPGILSPLYLNILELKPGEAVYIPAGELHAYLDGTGMELMANSDNVLRGGLTPKNVDVPELLSCLSFSSRTPELVTPVSEAGVTVYPVPAEEFVLKKIEASGTSVNLVVDSAQIMICLDGTLLCTTGSGEEADSINLEKGDSFFVSAAAGLCRIEGHGSLYSAGIPGKE